MDYWRTIFQPNFWLPLLIVALLHLPLFVLLDRLQQRLEEVPLSREIVARVGPPFVHAVLAFAFVLSVFPHQFGHAAIAVVLRSMQAGIRPLSPVQPRFPVSGPIA